MKKSFIPLLSLLGATAIFAPQSQAAMVYYVPFDDGSSATLANNGTLGGTATLINRSTFPTLPVASTTVAPNIGSAYSENFPLSSSNQVGPAVELPGSSTPLRMTGATDQMTISTWIQRTDVNGGAEAWRRFGIVSTLPGPLNTGWSFTLSPTGQLHFDFGNVNGNAQGSVGTIPIDTNWYHIAVTVDNAASRKAEYYINGVLQTVTGTAWTAALATTNTKNIVLGTGTSSLDETVGGFGSPVNSMLDDVAIWDTVLTLGKIRSIDTTPTLLSGYNTGDMNQLFTLFDSANPVTSLALNGKTWYYTSGLTGHADGDAWNSGGFDYIQLASGTGVFSAVPEPATWVLLAGTLTTVIILRRRRQA